MGSHFHFASWRFLMKKLLILPLTATLLSACTSDTPAPVVSIDNLPLNQEEPQIRSTEEVNNRWNDETETQNNDDQNQVILEVNDNPTQDLSGNRTTTEYNFDENFTITRDSVTGRPIYSKIKKGGYKGRHYRVKTGDSLFLIAYISGNSVEHIAKLNQLTAPYNLRDGQILILVADADDAEQQSNGKPLYIPRNAQTNKPEYNKMEKGFYREKAYTVRQGDTLYLVSYISGQSVEELARLNKLSAPYDLYAGQVLKLNTDASIGVQTTKQAKLKKQPTQVSNVSLNQPAVVKKSDIARAETTKFVQNLKWQWPAQGKIIDSFSSVDGGNKGIDIAGSLGQAVRAATSGQVVYAGNALQGYGNLIIIKHNNDYLSAYAHNQKILVKDKQWVKAGQEIATMGRSGTDKVKLHFEVRYKGQSTNPMKFLPKP